MNNRITTQIFLVFTLSLLISVCCYNFNYLKSYNPIKSTHISSTDYFSENFESTSYMDESETTVQGWGLGNITLPDKNITLSRRETLGEDIFIVGDILYIGGFYKIYIYNISNPSNPYIIGSNTSISFTIRGIYVDGDYLFAASYDDGLTIYNVSNPADIKFVTGINDYDVDGGVTAKDYHYAYHVWAIPSGSGTSWYVYLLDDIHGFVSFLFTEPALVVQTGGYDPAPDDKSIFVYDGNLFIQDDIAYCSYGDLMMIDISDRENPVHINTYTPENIDRFFLSGDLIYYEHYISVESSYFKILNISDPYSPIPVYSSELLTHSITSMSVSNGYAYLGYSLEVGDNIFAGYFDVYNVSNPEEANLIYVYASPFDHVSASYWYGVYEIEAVGNYSYMLDREFFINDINLIEQYESIATAQSTIIYSVESKFIDRVFLSASYNLPSSTDILYYLSVDNGTHWEQAYLNTWYSFVNFGSKLRWKALLSTSDPYISPSVFSISLTYRIILNAVNLTIPFNQSLIKDRTPYFEWTTITDATSYILQIDTSNSFSSPNLLNITSFNNNYTLINNLQDNTWYWRVAAIDSDGDQGPFSSIFLFILDGPPGVPIPLSPHLDDYLNKATPSLSWNNASDAYNYTIELDITDSFTSLELIEIGGIMSTEYTLPTPLNDTKWYWRVCAFDTSNNQGNFSENYYFTIDITNPTIDHPSDQEIDIGTPGIQIQWNPKDNNPSSYVITKNGEEIYDQLWDGSSIIINITSSVQGTFVYNCTVYDKAGNFNSDTIEVTIKSSGRTQAIPFGQFHIFFLIIGIISIIIIRKARERVIS
ncbi:MAG: hypothetical protein ACFFDH_02900 [Promethearchaeota archaeon]